jgi:hypothetical protein
MIKRRSITHILNEHAYSFTDPAEQNDDRYIIVQNIDGLINLKEIVNDFEATFSETANKFV